MKKLLLTLCACATLGTVLAQDLKNATLYVPELDIESESLMIGTIYGVSSNGEYAVGYDDFLGTCSYMWSRSTGEFELIDLAAIVCDVSNEGVVVGSYWIEIPGTDGYVGAKPGYYKDGEWHSLPSRTPDAFLVEGDMNPNGWAGAISADGKYIAGHVPDPDAYKFAPILWKWDDAAQDYVIENQFDEILEEIDVLECPFGWVTKGMSDDGSVITGFYEWGSGARSAAVMIDGKAKRLTCLQDPMEQEEGEWLDAEGWAQVSANGEHFAGYYAASANGTGMAGWVWNPSQEEVTFIDDYTVLVSVDNNGVAYGSDSPMGAAMKYENGECKLIANEYQWDAPYSLSTIFATSDDGGVLGGMCMAQLEYFGVMQVPAILILNETEGVANIQAQDNNVVMYGGVAFISGAYNKAQVYNVQGVVVAEATEGNIDLNNVPAGVYIVNVDGKSFKVVK